MTKNEILKYFKDINHAYNDCTRYDTLKHMLDELQEPCGDAISRQAVINAIANTCFWLSADNWEELIKCINSISPVTPQPKMGQWIVKGESWYCSRCNEPICEIYDGKPYEEYCPNCGAKMQEVEE